MGQDQHKLNYMTPREVEESARLGRHIARKISFGKSVMLNAAIRHAAATGGIHAATALACQLLGMNHANACKHVATLLNTKPDDIVSPHYK